MFIFFNLSFRVFLFFFLFIDPIFLKGAEIIINIKNNKSDSGFIHIALYNSEEKFLEDEGKFIGLKKKTNLVVQSGISVKNLIEGNYAIAIYHDENENDNFDRLISLPLESYGFSNNAEVFFGPPSFKESSFFLRQEEILEIEIELR